MCKKFYTPKGDKTVMWRSFLIVIGILLAIPGIFAGMVYCLE